MGKSGPPSSTEEKVPPKNDGVITKKDRSSFSDLWKKADYWAIWLGFFLFALGGIIYSANAPEKLNETITKANAILIQETQRAPFKTIAWYNALNTKKKLKATSSKMGKKIKTFTSKPHTWSTHIFDSLMLGSDKAEKISSDVKEKYEIQKNEADIALTSAKAAENRAFIRNFSDQMLNQKAMEAIMRWRMAEKKTSALKKRTEVKPYNIIFSLMGLMFILSLFFGIGMKVMGYPLRKFMMGFFIVFLIATIAYIASSNATIKHYGIGYPAFAILIGLIISNTIGTPKWVMPAVQSEYYIKTGLVLFGAEILFDKILSVGITDIFVPWGVTSIVLLGTFIFGQKVLKTEYAPGQKLNLSKIWHRFPKFILGFIAASIIFSYVYDVLGSDAGYALIDHGIIRGMSKIFREWFFCLAFVSMGLATDFRELGPRKKGFIPKSDSELPQICSI